MKLMLFLILSLSLVLTTLPSIGFCGDGVVVTKANTNEEYERDVDEVAAASQEQAILKLTGLLKKYRKTRQEAVLLAKLAELQQQNASIRFRIAHGMAHRGKKTLDLSSYKKNLKQSITTLTELISKYPSYEEISLSYHMRGKAYEEIGDKKTAARDYLHLVGHYPETDEAASAYMSLAEFAIEANDHPRAITYLKEVEKRPDNPHYPFALYKLAWSNYNLKNIPTALSYAERQIDFYSKKTTTQVSGPDQTTSDDAFRENMLLDATVFFLEGFEQKLSQYAISEALPYFKKLDNGPVLGRMILRYAKLLRSHNHETNLVTWKEQVLLSESDRPESLEVLITTYESQLNRRQYGPLVESAHDMVRLYKKHKEFESFPKAQKLLLDTAEGLQTLVIKNRGADGVQKLSTHLAAIYDAFTHIVDESDLRIPRVHYNLAETLFEIREFNSAAEHYRWVVDHPKGLKGKGAPNRFDAALKAIASRYETLKQRALIPGELTPKAISSGQETQLDPLFAEWIEWVDEHMDAHTWPKSSKNETSIENFYFEANRALYATGQITKAIERMVRFAKKKPASRFAVPSISLALDTTIASADWEQTYDLADDLLDRKEWKKLDFSKHLFTIAADSFFKLLEAEHTKKDYKATLKKADEFLERYAKTGRLADTLSLAGNAALALNEKEKAIEYFSRLIAEAPKAETVPAALLARASLEEEKFQFAAASKDYRSYLAIKRVENLRRKALMLAWLSGERAELTAALASPSICTSPIEADAECESFQALATLEAASTDNSDLALKRMKKAADKSKTLWAAVGLEASKETAFRDRLTLLRQAARHFDDLDPIFQFAMMQRLTVSIPQAFAISRMSLRQVAPLRADARYITRRVEVIREIENAATQAMKLPWSRIRALVLSEVAGLYLDLSRGLQKLPAPKGLPPEELTAYEETVQKLVLPFEEKGQDIRRKAFEIASRSAIEEEAFQLIAEPFFQDNPSQAKALKTQVTDEKPVRLDLTFLASMHPEGKWNKLDQNEDSQIVQFHWMSAVKKRNWQQIAFFLQQAKEAKLTIPHTLGFMKVIALSTAGARGEALVELDEIRKELAPTEKDRLTRFLANIYQQSLAHEQAQKFRKELPQPK